MDLEKVHRTFENDEFRASKIAGVVVECWLSNHESTGSTPTCSRVSPVFVLACFAYYVNIKLCSSQATQLSISLGKSLGFCRTRDLFMDTPLRDG